MRSFFLRLLFITVLGVLLFSCSDEEIETEDYLTEPVCSEIFTPKNYEYHVVGFYPYYRQNSLPISSISWEKLTRIIYAFARPNADGTLNTSDLTGIAQFVEEAHAHGVEAYFSVGGGGSDSENFPAIANNNVAADRLVKEIRQYLYENCLDGVDIDWENWTGSQTNTVIQQESMTFADILQKLKNEIEPFGLGISIDVYASDWGGKHYLDIVEDHINYVQVMAYDFSGPWSAPGPHSSYEDAIGSGASVSSTGLAYWVNYRHWNKAKILLGVPFYGRDFDNQGGAGIAYSQILDLYPDAWQYDQMDNIYYNGIATMTQKAQYVKDQQYPGVMIWELGQDLQSDSLSLLSTLDQVLNP